MVEYLLKLIGSDMLRSGEWSSTLVIISIFGSLFLFDGNSFKVGDPGRFNDLSTFGHFLVVVCFGSGKTIDFYIIKMKLSWYGERPIFTCLENFFCEI